MKSRAENMWPVAEILTGALLHKSTISFSLTWEGVGNDILSWAANEPSYLPFRCGKK